MNFLVKHIIKKVLYPKLDKLVKSSSNTFDDKFLVLFKELIENYL